MSFKFAQMTDSHLWGPHSPFPDPRRDDYYRKCAREVAAHGVDFIVHTGDLLTAGAGYERFRHFKTILNDISRELGIPYYVTRGNHDSSLTDVEFAGIYGDGT